jgi:hypothetical protein
VSRRVTKTVVPFGTAFVPLKDPSVKNKIYLRTREQTMTWTAFFQAMRKGTVDRAATMTRRGGSAQQTAGGSRSISTEAQAPKKEAKRPTKEWEWDLLILDVSETWHDI